MGRRALVPQVTKQLIDLILAGRLKPGDRINQIQLAKTLGISPTPLRAALHALAVDGLVRFSDYPGLQVSPLTMSGIIENTEMGLALEAMALRKAIPLLTEEDIDELERILERIDRLQDPREWYFEAWNFYHRLLAPSGYENILEVIRKTIFQTVLVLPLFSKVSAAVRSEEPNSHTMLAACRRRDVEGAIRALEAFNRKACKATIALIQARLESERDLPSITK